MSQSSQPTLDNQRFNQIDELQTQISSSGFQSQVDSVESQSVLADLTGVVNDACEAVFRAPAAPVFSVPSSNDDSLASQDCTMADPPSARKRVLSSLPDSRSRGRKVSRHSSSHLPPGVASAASLARSRSSSGSRSASRSRSSSIDS